MKKRAILHLKLTFAAAGILCIIAGCSKGSPEPNSDPGPDPDPETIEVIRVSKMEVEEKAGFGVTHTFSLSYNDSGFLTKFESTGAVHEHFDIGYDAENKVTHIGGIQYSYDSKSRVTKRNLPDDATGGFDRQVTFTYNDQDLVVASRYSRSVINGDGETITTYRSREYEYNASGTRLLSVSDKVEGSEQAYRFSMEYSAERNNITEVKCEVTNNEGATFTHYLTYIFTYAEATDPTLLIRNSMGLADGISTIQSPILPHSTAAAFGGDLFYHSPNIVRTMKHIQYVGTTYTHTTTYQYIYSYDDEGNPVKIEQTINAPNTPEVKREYNISYETLTIEK